MEHILLLASKSIGRQQLLREAQIPFSVIGQDADEHACDWSQSLEQVVRSIARHKMEHALLPNGIPGQTCFVLTADTLTADHTGALHGKPRDKEDALAKFRLFRSGARVGTAFCLVRKYWHYTEWVTEQSVEQFVDAYCELNIPESALEDYTLFIPGYLNYSGGMDIQGFGAQFVKTINGSYTTILGLPMFELREQLHAIGFFNTK